MFPDLLALSFASIRYAPNRRCHSCGQATIIECQLSEAFGDYGCVTPYRNCKQFIKSSQPLEKLHGGWDYHSGQYPVASRPKYGDVKAFHERLLREKGENHGEHALDATETDSTTSEVARGEPTDKHVTQSVDAANKALAEVVALEAKVRSEARIADQAVKTAMETADKLSAKVEEMKSLATGPSDVV